MAKVTIVGEPKYLLELTNTEATVLRKILGNIGGYPNGTRGVADDINLALANAGVKYAIVDLQGELVFKDGEYK